MRVSCPSDNRARLCNASRIGFRVKTEDQIAAAVLAQIPYHCDPEVRAELGIGYPLIAFPFDRLQ